MTAPASKLEAREKIEVLIGVCEPAVEQSFRNLLRHALQPHFALRFTVKEYEADARIAVAEYDYRLVILFVNMFRFAGDESARFDRAVELIRHCKARRDTAVVAVTTQRPAGFVTAAEQAGVHALVNTPYHREALGELILNALKFRNRGMTLIHPGPRTRRVPPRRILLLDDDPQTLEMLSRIMREGWPDAAIVACADSYMAWDDLRRSPPDLFITDLIHGGVSSLEILGRLADLKAAFPILVISAQLPERESEARAQAGNDLSVSYWPKPFNATTLTQHLQELLGTGQ
jgi:CheY-like chemotaxis protein